MLTSKKHKANETFNDGVINVLEASDGVITKTLHSNIHFGKRTYGIKRFYEAQVTGSEIERLVSIPFNYLVDRKNLIELKDFHTGQTKIYKIAMYQEKYDTTPASIYLALVKTEIQYVDNRTT